MPRATGTKNRIPKASPHGKPRAASRRAAIESNGGRAALTFFERKSIEQFAAEQGVQLEGQLERILGAGADLWASDAEFEEFVHGIYRRRREGLTLNKR